MKHEFSFIAKKFVSVREGVISLVEVTVDVTPGEPPSNYEYGQPLQPGTADEIEIISVKTANGDEIKASLNDEIINVLEEEAFEKTRELEEANDNFMEEGPEQEAY
jgi:hypothetical protein